MATLSRLEHPAPSWSLPGRSAATIVALVIIMLMLAAVTPGAPRVHAQGETSFSLRPANPDPRIPATQSYFIYTIAAGAGQSDEVLVLNTGASPVTLDLYIADAVTGSTSGAVYTNQGIAPTGAGAWVKLPETRVTVPANSTTRVPFEITVPTGARAGQYLAGIVAQSAELSSGGQTNRTAASQEGQFTLTTVTRVVAAIAFTVPGTPERKISVTNVRTASNPAGTLLIVSTRNDGNVMVKPRGRLVLRDAAGAEVASIPLSMDTILPGGTAEFTVPWPKELPAGDYHAEVNLETVDALPTPVPDGPGGAARGAQPGGAASSSDGTTAATVARAEFTSQPISVRPAEIEQTTTGVVNRPGQITVRRAESDGLPWWVPYAGGALALLLIVNIAVVLAVVRRRA